jgi:hypothetical protein
MTEQEDMTCAELRYVAAELALGVLTGRERARAVAHLETCDACQEDVRQLMATGEQLAELLPPAEPPLGFETRVLARLGLSAPASTRAGNQGRHPGHARRFGWSRRMLAAAALVLAVIAGGLGGWGLGAGPAPAGHAALPLAQTTLLSATKQDVGRVFLYSGKPRWMYMSVELGTGNEQVTCEAVSADGRVTVLGWFRLSNGYGAWGSPDPGNLGTLRGARLVTAAGTVLASATFSHW